MWTTSAAWVEAQQHCSGAPLLVGTRGLAAAGKLPTSQCYRCIPSISDSIFSRFLPSLSRNCGAHWERAIFAAGDCWRARTCTAATYRAQPSPRSATCLLLIRVRHPPVVLKLLAYLCLKLPCAKSQRSWCAAAGGAALVGGCALATQAADPRASHPWLPLAQAWPP